MVKEYIQVEDQKDLVRDPNSKAILNTNIQALSAYKKRKQTYAKIEKIDQLENKVKNIENKIDEVLTTLKKLL
jgi:hypothetical protein